MRNSTTKVFLTLALIFLAVGGAKAEKVYSIDYSTYTSFPWHVMEFTPTFDGTAMIDDGGGWHQYFIADGIPTVVGNDYVVKAMVKATANITLGINMGWGWGANDKKSATVTIPQSDDFVEVTWTYKSIGATSCNLVAQPNTNEKITWKSLAVYTADAIHSKNFGDLRTVTHTLRAKGGPDWTTIEPTPNENGEYVVASKNNPTDSWDTQFWIGSPEAGLPAGQKFHLKFKYKADAAATAETQTHGNIDGGYIIWHCIGDVNFTTEWQTFDQEVTIQDDMDGWRSVAFNLNFSKTANTYYFKDIELKVPEYLGDVIDFSVGAAGWATYSSNYNVSLGTNVGYKAHYNGSYIELTPVTEVPAGAAVLIEGAGKHTFNVVTSATAITGNDLLVSDGNVTGDGTIYVLAKKDNVVGFYQLKTGSKVPAGKAYLKITSSSSAPEFMPINGNTTGIKTIDTPNTVENGGVIFDLSGRRVEKPTKGLYIVNGKKVILK